MYTCRSKRLWFLYIKRKKYRWSLGQGKTKSCSAELFASWWITLCVETSKANLVGVSNLLQVIHMATHWIQLWSLLLPEDQRGLTVTGCSRLLTVAHDIFSRAGWRHSSRLNDVEMLFIFYLSMVDPCINLMWSLICNNLILKLCNKMVMCIVLCRGRGSPHFQKKLALLVILI
jgi:hypothetical protein